MDALDAIISACGGRRSGPRSAQIRCPVADHGQGRGDRNPSVSVTLGDDGAFLAYCHGGCAQDDLVQALRDHGVWPKRSPRGGGLRHHARRRRRAIAPASRVQPTRSPERDLSGAQHDWRRAFIEAELLSGTLGENYLAEARGVGLPRIDTVRFHPTAPFPVSRPDRREPGLIALIHDVDGRLIGAQATALRADGRGKIAGPRARHTFGRIAGGAVRLSPLMGDEMTGLLAIAEGLETALGVTRLFDIPCWAALGSNLGAFACPPGVDHLTIAADHDAAGLTHARTLATREAAERWVEIWHPTTPGEDWADVCAAMVASNAKARAV